MDDPYSTEVRLWKGWTPALEDSCVHSSRFSDSDISLSETDTLKLYTDESLSVGENQSGTAESEPCSLQWFLDIETLRHKKHGRWISSVLEFERHTGETLLGLGPGLGTDWVQYARHGASVVVCSPTSEHLSLVRRNFELRQLPGSFLHAPTPQLPVNDASIDVVCMNSLPEEAPEQQRLISEVYRVLKPGGKVLCVVPAYYDIDLWRRLLHPWHYWWNYWRKGINRPSQTYTGRQLRKKFEPFVEFRVHKRHLRRADVPHLWRILSLTCLERLIGRVLILKAFKPLSAAIPSSLAA